MLRLSEFARIGKAPFITGCGIKDNHTVYTGKVTKTADNMLEETPIYINEKNRYGERAKMSKSELKLFYTLHHSYPDNQGIVKNVDPAEYAYVMNCCSLTVVNALHSLVEKGYINICHSHSLNVYHVLLIDYEKYGLSATEGGTGYATSSIDYLNAVNKMEDVNQVRIVMRTILDLDTISADATYGTVSLEYNLRDYQLYLPKYLHKFQIRKIIDKVKDVLSFTTTKDTVTAAVSKSKHARSRANSKKIHYYHEISVTVGTLNYNINELNKAVLKNDDYGSNKKWYDNFYEKLVDDGYEVKRTKSNSLTSVNKNLELQEQELEDLAGVALSYSLGEVMDALKLVYNTRVNKPILSFEKIHSIPALVRSICSTYKIKNCNECYFDTLMA